MRGWPAAAGSRAPGWRLTAVSTGSAAASYRGLLAEPALRRLALADACARLPQGMVSITLLLVAAQHASMTVAGLVVAGYTLGQAVTGPLRGRMADRRGLGRVAARCSAWYALALLALLGCSLARAPAWSLVGAAAAAGLLNPPLSPGMRSLWSARAGASLAQAAFALDAATFDLAYITGPVLASALATGVAPAAALGVLLALTAAAVVAIGGRDPRTRPAPGASPRRRLPGPLRSAALRRLLVSGALANAALSATEVALTGYVRHHHALWASGPLLAEVSVGSIVGSLLLGARARPAGGGGGRLTRLLCGYALGLAALTAAGLDGPLLAVAAPLAGLCLGPTLATLFGAAAGAAPDGGGTETQAWLNSIMNGGAAGGAALAGAAAGTPLLALGLAAAAAAAAAASSAAGLAYARSSSHETSSHETSSHETRRRRPMKLSARNQIPARITSISTGEAIANVELDAGGTRLVASVTVEAVRDLGLAVGTEVTAVIKASDVILAVSR
jgi:molybdopterin-binding protein